MRGRNFHNGKGRFPEVEGEEAARRRSDDSLIVPAVRRRGGVSSVRVGELRVVLEAEAEAGSRARDRLPRRIAPRAKYRKTMRRRG